MKRLGALIAAALIAFLVGLVVFMPARLVFDLALRPAGIQAGLVHGSVLDAGARRLTVGGASLAAADARLRPLSLLSGRASFDVELSDPDLRGAGRVSFSAGGVQIEAAEAVVRLDRIPALAAAGAPAGETARIEIDRIVLDRAGACTLAEGRVTSSALVAAGEPFGVALPPVAGRLFCQAGAPALELSASNEALTLTGLARLERSGPDWRIEAQSERGDVAGALSRLGFRPEGSGWMLDSAHQGDPS